MSLKEKYSIHQIDEIDNLNCQLTPRTSKAFNQCGITIGDIIKLS